MTDKTYHFWKKNKKGLLGALVLCFWIAVWYAAALLVNNELLLVTPIKALKTFLALLGSENFIKIVAYSLLRIGAGFFAGFVAAVLLAVASYRYSFAEILLKPFITFLKTVPVVSFIVLLLIWWGSSVLSALICFLVVLPTLYLNILEGLKNTPKDLLEMSRVFRIPAGCRFAYVYRPALKPFLMSGLALSLGMCWKSGVAAEVIGIPGFSLGERLYLSKITLDTSGLFAWTAVILLLSILFEKIVLALVKAYLRFEPACRAPQRRSMNKAGRKAAMSGTAQQTKQMQNAAEGSREVSLLKMTDVSRQFGGTKVLTDWSLELKAGEQYLLTGPSGSGKTTLLKILAGLTAPTGGSVHRDARVSMVFQEDRLLEDYSALKNVELVTGDAGKAREALLMVLADEDLYKPCRELSGGMRRRVALVRALEADSDIVLLDEPFTGMDKETVKLCRSYLSHRIGKRCLVMSFHDPERSVDTLKCEKIA